MPFVTSHMHIHAFFYTEVICDICMPQLSQGCHFMCIFIEITTNNTPQKLKSFSCLLSHIHQHCSFWSKEKCGRDLRTFMLIVSAHLYCTRKFTHQLLYDGLVNDTFCQRYLSILLVTVTTRFQITHMLQLS